MTGSILIGVDVGGTFTDIFVLDAATGRAEVAKVPTSRPDQSAGFLAGIGQRVADLGTVATVAEGHLLMTRSVASSVTVSVSADLLM